jgi:hypothetical protein
MCNSKKKDESLTADDIWQEEEETFCLNGILVDSKFETEEERKRQQVRMT